MIIRFRNLNTNVEISEREYDELLKREYHEYLQGESEPVTFDKFCEDDRDFEVVEYVERQEFKSNKDYLVEINEPRLYFIKEKDTWTPMSSALYRKLDEANKLYIMNDVFEGGYNIIEQINNEYYETHVDGDIKIIRKIKLIDDNKQ